MRVVLALLALACWTVPAAASGGFSCTGQDPVVRLSVEAIVSRGMGSAIFSLSGKVGIDDDSLPDDLRTLRFERTHAAQYWLDAGSLKLLLYREREGDMPHAYVELLIETAAHGDEGGFAGDYRLAVYDAERGGGSSVSFAGAVSCTAE